ncbi:MAG: PSD1 and planctomycete cytochrome C domain-containing protein [Chthoniobacter sp.]|uniref:PSD1 and planctomycete cytochrome C domain-containing protein n=1 Tax=Chthoniobacter sp. TaxID=2510640 RepID=UPI0032A57F2E
MKPYKIFSILTLLAAAGSAMAALDEGQKAEPPPGQALPQDQADFFEKKIRPVLTDKCYKCHSEKAEKVKGGLLLDTREGVRRGGDSGPAVVPGNLKDSLLIDAIHYGSKDTAMPPQKAGGKLSDEIIKDFEKWVQMGAPDPREGGGAVAVASKKYDTEKAKDWWSFRAPKKTVPPAVQDAAWARTDIDRFLLAGLEAKGIKPVADADKLTLIRRVYFDLVGVPPSLDEITAFVQDKSPNAFATVVDRLLNAPQFGERWGRHWLDVARYAESSGKESNFAYPHAWRYRDYVVAAFNADKPYDEFLREQIAGDLLPAKDERERAEHEVATGYLALGAKSQNEMNPRQFALDVADEQIDALSQGVLGMTIACARCHDHKFDPIPQREYYAMAGIFLSTDTRYGTASGQQNRHATPLIELPSSSGLPVIPKTMSAQERAQKEKQLADLQKERDSMISERMALRREGKADNGDARKGIRLLILLTQAGALEADLASFDTSGRSKILVMGAKDRPAMASASSGFARFGEAMRAGKFYGNITAFPTITDSPLYTRGDVEKPGDKVPRGFISVLSTDAAPAIQEGTSGRRELAEWITAANNPLTSRVMVNRVWHWLFGSGIVESTDNFGTTGHLPSNQALLDNLAIDFRDKGYSVKKMIREMVLSHAYQLSSTYNEKNFAGDPENTLLWRMSKRRLDAECIRDAMLSVSGDLQYTAPIGSTIAMLGDGMINGPRGRGINEGQINAETPVRSVYLSVARDAVPESLALFDFAENSLVTGERETTNVPSQALFMLNSGFVAKRAERLSERVVAGYPAGPNGGLGANLQERITYAYWLVFSRPPDNTERAAAASFFTRFPASWAKGQSGAAGVRDAEAAKAAWTSFCRALFASAEFRYLN